MNININEVFVSVQGEGYRAGQPAIFVRLQGCHIGCPFCDTRYAWKTRVDDLTPCKIDGVIETLLFWKERYPNINLIVLTGGEPFEQLEAVYELVHTIKDTKPLTDMVISIETSGGIDEPNENKLGMLINVAGECEITLSPKLAKPPFGWFFTWCHSVKLLIGKSGYIGPGSIQGIKNKVTHALVMGNRLYLQPLDWGSESDKAQINEMCINMSLKHGLPISIQAHKFLKCK